MFALRPGIFCDRDGVINKLIEGGTPGDKKSYIHSYAQIEWTDGVFDAFEILYTEMGKFNFFIVSNQSGVTRWGDTDERFSYSNIESVFQHMFVVIDDEVRQAVLSNADVPDYPQVPLPGPVVGEHPTADEVHVIRDMIFCPHGPDDGCCCRKPKPGMIYFLALRWGIDLGSSWMIGDSQSDMKVGWNGRIRRLIKIDKEAAPFDEENYPHRYSVLFNRSEGLALPSFLDAIKFIRHWDNIGTKK